MKPHGPPRILHVPHGQGSSLSPYIARLLDIVDKSGVPSSSRPWDVMGVVTPCFKDLQADCSRIGMNLKMDYRAGPQSRLRSKIEAVEAQLGRKLRT